MKFENCGTNAGYMKHYRIKESPCDECLLAHSKYTGSWAKENSEKAKLNNNKWRKNNPDSHKNYNKVWRKENIDKHRESCRNSDRKRRSAYHEPYTEFQVIDTYGDKCHICNKSIDLLASRSVGSTGWKNALHIDHLVPLSKGGHDTIQNVRPSHGICNLQKTNK
jgi:5-methylcytosine-specific restriction endonuclease McrA